MKSLDWECNVLFSESTHSTHVIFEVKKSNLEYDGWYVKATFGIGLRWIKFKIKSLIIHTH